MSKAVTFAFLPGIIAIYALVIFALISNEIDNYKAAKAAQKENTDDKQ